MSDTYRGVRDGGQIAVASIDIKLVEVDAIVVSQLTLEHYIVVDTIPKASADSEVAGTRLGHAQVVQQNTGLNSLLSRTEWTCKQEREQDNRG